ncbi:MAG: hypothetical protein HYZ24_15435 [Chloroflexi bacterium]|nr:hypothetical protein [Chloroflexota bacterium]
MPLDINLTPLYRIQGREPGDMPGVLAMQPPKTAARGREQDRLLVYLLLAGNAAVTAGEYRKLAEDTANVFYQTPRAVTSALRAAADSLNRTLLDRNMSASARGQYALAWMTLAVLRESHCIFSLNGPMHVYWAGADGSRHYFEPSLSGKGLGASQSINIHYAQADLAPNDTLLFCGRVPNAWNTPLENARPAPLETTRRRLTSLTTEDLNAVLTHVTEGSGAINIFKGTNPAPQVEEAPEPAPTPEPASEPRPDLPAPIEPESTPGAHLLQPSAYSIPPQNEEPVSPPPSTTDPLAHLPHKTVPREFPASIPRAKPKTEADLTIEDGGLTNKVEAREESLQNAETQNASPQNVEAQHTSPVIAEPREPSPQAKQAAKTAISIMHAIRHGSAALNEKVRNFLPRLLPAAETTSLQPVSSSAFMGFMAVLIPLIVVTVSVVVYMRYGRNEQYDVYYNQAEQLKTQALSLTNPVEQRRAWENVLANLNEAEKHNVTSDTLALREEAQTNLDSLLAILRMQFNPAFSANPNIEVSRMAATENDLYLLNAATGEVMRAFPSGSGGFELDTTFDCRPGSNNSAGQLVDILTLPITNIYGATVLGIDSVGNLVYCKPGSPPQTGLLPTPDTNWNHITSMVLDGGNLYVLDAPARAVWVYPGKEAAFVDRPYFFFGQQTPTQDVIDFLVSGDEMYLLHADGRVSRCIFSRIDTSASKCEDPLNRINPIPAYADMDLFAGVNFTQILFAAPPDPSILLLDAGNQNLMRFAARTLELQNQFQPTTSRNPIPSGTAAAVAVSPDHVLYLAVDGQIFFASNMP